MGNLIMIGDGAYLSYDLLAELGVSKRTIEKWTNYDVMIHRSGSCTYVCMETIPNRTKSKLPSIDEIKQLLKNQESNTLVNNIYKKLIQSQSQNTDQYSKEYRLSYHFDAKKALQFGMKRAVWDNILKLHNNKKGTLDALFNAYCKVYPNQYSSKIKFSDAIKKAKEIGLELYCIDKRSVTINSLPKYDEFVKYLITGLLERGDVLTAPQILKSIKPVLHEKGYKCPSLSWIKNLRTSYKENTNVQLHTYGKLDAQKTQPYASMITALNPGSQWQIDGWTLPFWGDKFQRYTLFVVRDAHSKKIVGYSIALSENTISILQGLEDAVMQTGGLPFEIVSDNHSFNKTKEAEYFKSKIAEYKTTWTITENPQHKSIAERYFRVFGDDFCKGQQGYLGQGVKTKLKNGRVKPELIEKYAKDFLSEAEIKLIAIKLVNEFNNTPLPKIGKSPNEIHSETSKPYFISLEVYDRLKIFLKQSEYKIQRGQINIIRGGVTHEFQVNTEIFRKYNGRTVSVRYDTLDMIYLFNAKSDEYITTVKAKSKIHGALADQTADDESKYYKNKSLIKSIKTKDRNDIIELTKKAHEIDPDAHLLLNRLTTAKDVLKAFEESSELRQRAYDMGIDISQVQTVKRFSLVDDEALKPIDHKRKGQSPFTPKNHKISKINPNDYE